MSKSPLEHELPDLKNLLYGFKNAIFNKTLTGTVNGLSKIMQKSLDMQKSKELEHIEQQHRDGHGNHTQYHHAEQQHRDGHGNHTQYHTNICDNGIKQRTVKRT